jgi:hypothetical protein
LFSSCSSPALFLLSVYSLLALLLPSSHLTARQADERAESPGGAHPWPPRIPEVLLPSLESPHPYVLNNPTCSGK